MQSSACFAPLASGVAPARAAAVARRPLRSIAFSATRPCVAAPQASCTASRASVSRAPIVPSKPVPSRAVSRAPVSTRASDSSKEDSGLAETLGATAKANLRRAADNCSRLGWISFWTQLVLSSVSIVILLFSVAFSQTTGPTATVYLTLFGVILGFVSTLWAFRYTRMGRSIKMYLEAKEGSLPEADMKKVKKISKLEVLRAMNWGAFINLLGMGSTLLGLQATVGILVAKTLTNATANPFLAGGTGSYNPVLALDVFLVQGSTNTLLCHFCGIIFSMWLARSIDGSTGVQGPPTSLKGA